MLFSSRLSLKAIKITWCSTKSPLKILRTSLASYNIQYRSNFEPKLLGGIISCHSREKIIWDKKELKSFLLASLSSKPRDEWAWKLSQAFCKQFLRTQESSKKKKKKMFFSFFPCKNSCRM